MSVNSENHVLGLWIGGGVTPAALEIIEECMLAAATRRASTPQPVRVELINVANACRAQLSKLTEPDPKRYL